MAIEIDAVRAPAEPRGSLSLAERGRNAAGETIFSDRRLWVQLSVFRGRTDRDQLIGALRAAALQGVLYEDVNHPDGFGLLTFSEDPSHFLDVVRPFVRGGAFSSLAFDEERAMLGRTYSIGYEDDLDEALLDRPRRTMLNPAWPWAIWYPLRRSGRFEQLPAEEQRRMLMEHGGIGRAYGRADHAHDVRLACHGLGTADNDFIVGIVGPALTGPSAVVQHMRRTQQTSLYIESLGPFFVGRALWQSET